MRAVNFDIPWNFVKEHLLHNFIKYFYGHCANQLINKDLNGASFCLSNLSFSASQGMLLKLGNCLLIWHLCTVHSIWLVKYVFFAKIWFMKTSTRIVNYANHESLNWALLFLRTGNQFLGTKTGAQILMS